MKNISYLIVILVITFSCKSTNNNNAKNNLKTVQNDTIKISNPDLEYDVIIIEPGYNVWLNSIAKPKGFYSQQYLEAKNYLLVTEWNLRVNQPQRYDNNLYELPVNYDKNTDYGYDVNYQLYNYFVYFQNKYNQNLLGGRVPAN